ncbi:hypothetical protein CEXT_722651 [Caerostris extrusa]|uniref:Uncharacterized protein n=1 Tax=Caerostris extrusa TaxID=172846 RepID=A0AAV4VFX7_CAEEX|nr:hypothetical protein CEXT_722651 [Caerostris extrusa]
MLAALDLSFNLIEKVANQSINFGYNIELYFNNNKITEFRDNLLFVQRVHLDQNLITTLGSTLHYSKVTQFSMANNLISHLGPEDFQNVQGLQELDLQGNLITQVERLTFVSIRKDLSYLNLSRNKIKCLQGCLQNLTMLTTLNLSCNRIEVFKPGDFYNMSGLITLYLDSNRIATLGSELRPLTSLQYLLIGNNQIRTITTNQIPAKLKQLHLAGISLHTTVPGILKKKDTPTTQLKTETLAMIAERYPSEEWFHVYKSRSQKSEACCAGFFSTVAKGSIAVGKFARKFDD